MTTLLFLLKRFFAQRLLGLALVVTLGFTIGVLVAGPIYADAAREAILSSATSTAATTVGNVRFATYGGPEFDDAAADAVVRDEVRGLPVDEVVTQGLGTVRLVGADGTQELSVPLLFRDGATEHLPYRGEPPVGAGQIALPDGTAATLGVRPGDSVTAIGPTGDEVELTVAGRFGPPDRDDPFWFGDQSPFPAPDSTEPSPALMDRAGYAEIAPQLGITTQWVWDVYLDLVGVPFERAEKIPGQIGNIEESLSTQPGFSQLQLITGLDTLLTLVNQRVADLRVPIFLVVFQIGAVTLAILAGVGSLVLSRQSFELAVLRSRGFSGAKLIAAQGVQAVFAAIVAYPLGLLLGMGLALLASNSNGPSLPGVLFPIGLSSFALALGAAGALVGAITLLLLSLPHVRRTILEERRLLSREGRPLLARVPIELFVLPVAIFAFVQLRGTEVLSTTERDQLDPLVLLTPTLLIFSLSFLALRFLLWVLRRLERPVGRSKSLPTYLAARRLGRSPGTSFATSLLLVLAVGLLIVSTSYRAIVLRNHEDSAHQQVGSDWNVEIGTPEQQLVALERTPTDAVAVVRTEPAFDRPGSFPLTPVALGVDPERFTQGGWWRSDYSRTPLNGWLRAIELADPGVEIAGDDFSATVTANDGASAGVEMLVTFERGDGEVATSSAGAIEQGTGTYEATLDGAERLLSISFFEEAVGAAPDEIDLELTDVAVGGEAIDLESWNPLRWRGSDGAMAGIDGGVSLEIDPGSGHVVGGIAPEMPPLPALVSPEIARSQGLEFEATLGGQRLPFRRAAIAEAFPSVAGDFMVVSTPALLQAAVRIPEAGLALNEMWSSGADDPRPALEEAGLIPGATDAAGPIIAVLAQLPQSLAVGMNFAAAVGGLMLVVLGVAVGLYFAQRRREFEFASLRSMGTQPGQVSRVLLLEQGLMIVFAIAAGAGIGLGILRLLMPYVGRSIGSAFPPPVLVVDWTSFAISLSAIIAATAIGLLAALRALLRSSVTSVLRGEAE
ncbi:MAG TPA: ABC transporter permease [Actinomycetota bacterium]|nr:ABC transporter permease [Actinomycetota bacterium]